MKKLLLMIISFVSVLGSVMAQEVYAYKMTKVVSNDGVISSSKRNDVCYYTFTNGGNTVYLSDSKGNSKGDITPDDKKVYKYQYTKDNCKYYRYERTVSVPTFNMSNLFETRVIQWDIMIVSMDRNTINIKPCFSKDYPDGIGTQVYKRVEINNDNSRNIPTLIE